MTSATFKYFNSLPVAIFIQDLNSLGNSVFCNEKCTHSIWRLCEKKKIRAPKSDGQAASGRFYTDIGTSGEIGRYEVAGVRFEACKLKSRREKLPSSSASRILERSSRLRATSGFGPTEFMDRACDCDRDDRFGGTRYARREKMLKFEITAVPHRTTRRTSARSRSINWEFHCRLQFIFVPSQRDRTICRGTQ